MRASRCLVPRSEPQASKAASKGWSGMRAARCLVPRSEPQASEAVASGAAEVVVCWRAMNERSQYRFGQPQAGGAFAPGGGTSSLLWCMPFGAQTPGSWAALRSRPYLDAFGVTNRDLGRLSVVQRAYAAKN